jgi:DNA-binding transcriptional LysR family regulator
LPQLNVILELGSAEAIKQGVMTGEAIGCLSLLTLQSEFANGSLKRLNIPDLTIKRDLLMVTQQAKADSNVVQAFKAFSVPAKPEKPRIRISPIIT